MKNQSGATLVIALSLLAIITLSVVYSLESSNIQSRMVANSVYSLRTYQATSNELSAAIRAFNNDPSNLLNNQSRAGVVYTPVPTTTPVGVVISNELIFLDRYDSNTGGNEVSVDSPVEYPLYELTSRGEFSAAVSNQSMGFKVQKLKIVGALSD